MRAMRFGGVEDRRIEKTDVRRQKPEVRRQKTNSELKTEN
jgi:hypothetical protein